MKKFFLFALATALFATSCDKNDNNWDLPEGYGYVTVMKGNIDPASDDDSDDTTETEVYFQFDSKDTFVVTENISRLDLDDLEEGQRLIAGVTLTESTDGIYDFTAKLYEVIGVLVGNNVTVTTEEESDAIADNQFSMIATDISLTKGYLNFLVYFESENIGDVDFNLVTNTFDEPAETDEDYLNLELRFDRASDESVGPKYERYLSFDMESYRELLADKDGILLRVKTLKSGTITVKVDSKDLYPEVE